MQLLEKIYNSRLTLKQLLSNEMTPSVINDVYH